MTRSGMLMIGGALALMCGAANAQGYQGSDDNYSNPTENVIVHGRHSVERHQMLGIVDGVRNPTVLTSSEVVDFSDLDLSRPADRRELRLRINDTAQGVCEQLSMADRQPFDSSFEARDRDRECVEAATKNAMLEVNDRAG